MNRLVSFIAVAAATASLASAALAGTPVQLRDQLVDDGDGRVTLGDLFGNAGRASNVVLAQGPAAGGNVVLDAARVQAIARANGLDWANASGFRRLVVKGGDAGGATASQAGRTVEVLTYTRSLSAGEVVRPEDVAWTRVQSHLVPGDAPADADAVIGQAARRALRSGAAVAGRDLSSPQVIKKDELIVVTFSQGGVSLSLQAKALQGAAAGDTLPVLNPQSKKTIVAVATGPGQAAVGSEADAFRAGRSASLR